MSDYWERRKAQQMFEYMAGTEERAGSIAKLYLQASRYFAGKMDTIFERYRKQNGLSEVDARRLLNQIRTPGDRRIKTAVAAGDGGREQRKAQTAPWRAGSSGIPGKTGTAAADVWQSG